MNQRRLTRAIGTNQGMNLTGQQRKRNLIARDQRAVALGQLLRLQHGVGFGN
jgi:hypothetical protein